MGSKLTPHRDTPEPGVAATAGFTLIELVVVVAVVSVLAVGAGLVASRGGASAMASDLKRFQRQSKTMRDRAVQGRQVLGLYVTDRGFQSAVETADGWQEHQNETRWRGRVVLQLKTPRRVPNNPHIRFLPDGRVSEFTLSFASGGGRRSECQSDGFAGISCDG
ncbi:MAG: GspH/FimT family pseudopilin [Sulfitobacter sp.]